MAKTRESTVYTFHPGEIAVVPRVGAASSREGRHFRHDARVTGTGRLSRVAGPGVERVTQGQEGGEKGM